MGQLLLFFLCNFSSFFSYVGGIPVTNHFSVLLIDRYLAIPQIITHKEHLWYSFWSVVISEPPQNTWHHDHNNRKWLKQPQIHFYWAVPNKSCHFFLFWCMLCKATPDISTSTENINSAIRVSILSSVFYDYAATLNWHLNNRLTFIWILCRMWCNLVWYVVNYSELLKAKIEDS